MNQDQIDAARWRKLCAALQQAYEGQVVEADRISIEVSMLAGAGRHRTVGVGIRFIDTRDEPLDFASALDRIPLSEVAEAAPESKMEDSGPNGP